MVYKIIALDIDGTFLNDASEIPPENTAALHAAAARGVHIVFASGRMSESVRRAPDAIGLDGPIISYNGAMVRDSRAAGDAVLFHLPLSSKDADEIIDYTRAEHLQLNYYLEERLYAWDNPAFRRLSGLYSSRTGSVYNFTPDLAQFKGCSPTKLIILANPTDASQPDPRHRDELYEIWKAKWGDEVNIICTDPEYLEFMHREANKGAALAHIAAHFGVAREQVIAIGDGRNDTAMIAWAGLGVAVANAHEEVKSAAKYVTEKDNNQAAVAEVIERFVKIG
jgi:hypothetical protein